MSVKCKIASILFGATIIAAAPALAATYDVLPQHAGGSADDVFQVATGGDGWSEYVKPTGADKRFRVGLFRLKIASPATDFLAFSLSPPAAPDVGSTYETDASLGLSTTALGQLGALVAHAWTTATTDASSAVLNGRHAVAFQLAAWEIVGENGAGDLSFRNGNFRLGNASARTRDQAEDWLGNIADGTWAPQGSGFTLLKWAGTGPAAQNLLTTALPAPAREAQSPVQPVPLPGAGLLMLAGLGALAGLRRRRKAA